MTTPSSYNTVTDATAEVLTYQDMLALPRLRYQEEAALAAQVQDGLAAGARLQDPQASIRNPAWDLQVPILVSRVEAGNTAHRRLWMHNFWVVDKIAKHNASRCGPCIDTEDLVQVGIYRLMCAVYEYQPGEGAPKFTLFAEPKVREAMSRAIRLSGYAMKLSTRVGDSLPELLLAYDELSLLYGREPTAKEVCKKLKGLPADEIETFLALQKVVELDDEEALSLDDAQTPELIASQAEQNQRIRELLTEFSEVEQTVIRLRFGIDCEERTLEQVGREFGITRERVRQVEAKVLSKMRHPSRNVGIYRKLF